MKKYLILLFTGFSVCRIGSFDGWTYDRLVAGSLMFHNKSLAKREYIQEHTPKSIILKSYYRDCDWGLYLNFDNDNGEIVPHTGLVMRF